jgi:hypothetical protein
MDCFVACAPRKDGYDTDSLVMPGLDPGIHLRKKLFRRKWITGSSSVKTRFALSPGDDDFTAPAKRDPHLYALYSRASEPKLRAKATSQ